MDESPSEWGGTKRLSVWSLFRCVSLVEGCFVCSWSSERSLPEWFLNSRWRIKQILLDRVPLIWLATGDLQMKGVSLREMCVNLNKLCCIKFVEGALRVWWSADGSDFLCCRWLHISYKYLQLSGEELVVCLKKIPTAWQLFVSFLCTAHL